MVVTLFPTVSAQMYLLVMAVDQMVIRLYSVFDAEIRNDEKVGP